MKQECPYGDYPALLELQFKNGVKDFKGYQTDRAAVNFIDVVGNILKENLVKDSLMQNTFHF